MHKTEALREREAGEEREDADADFLPLTRDEAARLRESRPPVPAWQVLGCQLVVGGVVAGLAWAWSGEARMALSAFYGALAVVVPGAVFARGLSSKWSRLNPGTALAGFFVWEAVKVVLTVAMLLAAPQMIVQLNWLALLAGFVVTMKVYWVAVWLDLGRTSRLKKME